MQDLSPIEADYIRRTPLEHRKFYAQFFTPISLADVMVDWLVKKDDLVSILEPAFGLGVFSRCLMRRKDKLDVKGFEIDDNILQESKKLYGTKINLLHQDYMYNDWDNKYDGIICNPPYFKFHDYDNKKVIEEIETRLSCKLNGFTNLYTLFLLKSIHQLKPGGRCAYIVPSEFLNSDYGALVKHHLLKTRALRHIIVFNFEESLFEDALTTSCLVLCENGTDCDTVRFTALPALKGSELIKRCVNGDIPDDVFSRIYAFSDIDPDIKWRKYYQESNVYRYSNLVPFSLYAKVMRGIATGANDFFVFNKGKAVELGINEEHLLPCVCKCADVKGPLFTEKDFLKLRNEDKNVYLLDAVGTEDENILKYLKMGISKGIDKKYLTSSRNPWYALENRPPSPIWVTVFNRKGLRFIRNLAGVHNLTTFHCVYPKHTLYNDVSDDLLFAYLQTDIAKEIFADNCREYGNGLQKFEPNDLNKGMMLDIALLPDNEKQRIEAMVNDSPSSLPVKEIEEILLNYFLS